MSNSGQNVVDVAVDRYVQLTESHDGRNSTAVSNAKADLCRKFWFEDMAKGDLARLVNRATMDDDCAQYSVAASQLLRKLVETIGVASVLARLTEDHEVELTARAEAWIAEQSAAKIESVEP